MTANACVVPLRIVDICPTNETCFGAATAWTLSGRGSADRPARVRRAGGGVARGDDEAANTAVVLSPRIANASANRPGFERRTRGRRNLADRTVSVVEGRGVGGVDVRGGGRSGAVGRVDCGPDGRAERVLRGLRVVLVEIIARGDTGRRAPAAQHRRAEIGRQGDDGGDRAGASRP